MHRRLPLLKNIRKLVLSFTNVDPQALARNVLLDVVNNLSHNVTPTFYKNKNFVHIGVHINFISICSTNEKPSKINLV
jgi:hypothetical protein